jgi:hypothetical protein
MSERQFILSQQKNLGAVTAIQPKSVFHRVMGLFIETFDSIATFVTKWTF